MGGKGLILNLGLLVKLNVVYYSNPILIVLIDQKKLNMFDPAFLDIPLVIAAKPDGSTIVLTTIRDNKSYVEKYSLEDVPDNNEGKDTTEWGITVPTIDQLLAANAKRKQSKGMDPVSKLKPPRKELIVTMPPSDDEMVAEPRVVRPMPRRPTQTHVNTPQRPTK